MPREPVGHIFFDCQASAKDIFHHSRALAMSCKPLAIANGRLGVRLQLLSSRAPIEYTILVVCSGATQ